MNESAKSYRAGAAARFIDQKLERGVYSFSLDELTAATGLSAIAARNQLLRLGKQVIRVAPREPYFLILTPDQRVFGAPSIDRWLDDYFKWLGRLYYLGLLSAAAVYGSSQQAVQEVQVVTDKPMRSITLGRIRIRFFMKSGIERTLTRQMPLAYAPLVVSTPESTMFDLIRYAVKIGGIERAAETIAPVLGEVSIRRLAKVLEAEGECATAQRLGFVLEWLGADKLAGAVSRCLPAKPQVIPLVSHTASRAADPVCKPWGVRVNSQEFLELQMRPRFTP